MKVKLLYFAGLRDLFASSEEQLTLSEGATLASLAEILSLRAPALRGLLPSLAWGVNLEFSPVETLLKDGDEVALLPPVSGGWDD